MKIVSLSLVIAAAVSAQAPVSQGPPPTSAGRER